MKSGRTLGPALALASLPWLAGCPAPEPKPTPTPPYSPLAKRRALLLVLPDGPGYRAFVGPSIVVARPREKVIWELKNLTGKDLAVEIHQLELLGGSPCPAASPSPSPGDPFEEREKRKEFRSEGADRELPLTVGATASGCYSYRVKVALSGPSGPIEIEADDPQVDIWK